MYCIELHRKQKILDFHPSSIFQSTSHTECYRPSPDVALVPAALGVGVSPAPLFLNQEWQKKARR